MKKGLLSILAGALLVVGCQNYDDQFDALETQINSLTATVAGLAKVQSDLTALAGTVSSLASTVSGLGDTIDTAVADGLTDIQADIDAIEAAVADVASSEEVSALSDAVADAQTDLTDLLAASSVFTGDVIVNSAQTLDAYHKMGAGLNIVNGNVDITVETSMDQAKVQELVDNILTTVKDFKYTSKASSIAETTFENLTGTRSLTITQGGGMRFPNLVSATNIYLKDDFESTVEVIHFGSLTSVATFNTDSDANTIQFTKATELHLTSLEYYPPATLTIETDEGAAMPFALDDLDADGDELEDGLTLNITGPGSFSISKIADGSITLTDVATVNLTDFKGAVTISGDVESFTSNSLVSLTTTGTLKVETVDVTGVADPDAVDGDDANYYGPAISLDALGDLETVTIAGVVESIALGSNNNLTDVTISADVAGSITIEDNSDLTSITLTGAKATALDVDSNADLTTLTVDLTWRAGTATGDVIDGDLDVTGNASLESLTVSSDNLENLEVTGNDELTTLDFTGVTKIGATGEAVVNIYNNDLTASKITDTDDGSTDVANGASGDLGSITSTSGIKTLKTYLTAVAADSDSTASVYFDTVESFVLEDDSEATDQVWVSGSEPDATKILVLEADNAVAALASIAQKRAFILDMSLVTTTVIDIVNESGVSIVSTDTDPNDTGETFTIESTDSPASALAKLQAGTTADRAAIFGINYAAKLGGTNESEIQLITYSQSTSVTPSTFGERYTTAAARLAAASYTTGATWSSEGAPTGVTTATLIKLTVGGNSVTASASVVGATATTTTGLATAIVAAWTAKYGATGTASNSALVDLEVRPTGKIYITGTASDSAAYNLPITVAVTGGGGGNNLDWTIGSTNDPNDNNTVGKDLIITLESTVAGTLLNKVDYAGVNSRSIDTGVIVEKTNTYYANSDPAAEQFGRAESTESRTDARNAEDLVAGTASTAANFSRISWL